MANRRTNPERSAATRQAILDATIHSLIEEGYAATSLQNVTERAGVSRGALTHQFPTKEALLLAAVDHLATARGDHLLASVGSLPEEAGRLEAVIGLLWQQFDGVLFHAAIELWNASRTDEALHGALLSTERDIGRRHRVVMEELLGEDLTASPRFSAALDAVLLQLRGAAMTNLLRRESDLDGEVVETCAAIFRCLTRLEPGDGPPG